MKEVIAAAARVTGRRIPVVVAGRRPGDPARLVANASLARRELGWEPRYPELAVIIEHAWKWEKRAVPLAPISSRSPDAKLGNAAVKNAPGFARNAQANEFAGRSESGTEVAAIAMSKKQAGRA